MIVVNANDRRRTLIGIRPRGGIREVGSFVTGGASSLAVDLRRM